jgi:glutamyl-tRNA synthetase
LSSLLLAALHCARHDGTLVLRIEDLDRQREVEGAADAHRADLEWLGVRWQEGPDLGGPCGPYVQSERAAHYEAARASLERAGRLYRCFCSRREVEEALSAPHGPVPDGLMYPGTCRALSPEVRVERARTEPFAWRYHATETITHTDEVWGPQRAVLSDNPGDFVLLRKDACVAYQLAVVTDDIAMGVTHVIRGVDLLDSAPRQIALFRALGAEPPAFLHVPLLVDARGERFSKRIRSVAREALATAGWTAPLLRGALATMWGWTRTLESPTMAALAERWRTDTLRRETIRVPDAFFEGPQAYAAFLTEPSPSSTTDLA